MSEMLHFVLDFDGSLTTLTRCAIPVLESFWREGIFALEQMWRALASGSADVGALLELGYPLTARPEVDALAARTAMVSGVVGTSPTFG